MGYGLGDSGRVCFYSRLSLNPNKNPLLLHAASEVMRDTGRMYQVKHILGHLETVTKMIKCLGNSTHNESALPLYCVLREKKTGHRCDSVLKGLGWLLTGG